MERIVSARLTDKRAGDGYSLLAVVRGVTKTGNPVKTTINLGTCPGAASYTKVKVLGDGKVAIFDRHMMARYNYVTGFLIRNHHIEIDGDYSEALFDLLPKSMQKKTINNNVMLVKAKGNEITLDYWTREERDGVKATFRVNNLKWTCTKAKYWRDKTWNGIRNF